MELLKHFFQNHLLLRRFHFDGMLMYISELHSSISKTCLVSSVVYICNDFKKCHLGWHDEANSLFSAESFPFIRGGHFDVACQI